MKKILLLTIIFFVSCTKEQVYPSTNTVIKDYYVSDTDTLHILSYSYKKVIIAAPDTVELYKSGPAFYITADTSQALIIDKNGAYYNKGTGYIFYRP